MPRAVTDIGYSKETHQRGEPDVHESEDHRGSLPVHQRCCSDRGFDEPGRFYTVTGKSEEPFVGLQFFPRQGGFKSSIVKLPTKDPCAAQTLTFK